MKNILYVDDVRFPRIWKEEINKVTIARNYEQALKNLLDCRFRPRFTAKKKLVMILQN